MLGVEPYDGADKGAAGSTTNGSSSEGDSIGKAGYVDTVRFLAGDRLLSRGIDGRVGVWSRPHPHASLGDGALAEGGMLGGGEEGGGVGGGGEGCGGKGGGGDGGGGKGGAAAPAAAAAASFASFLGGAAAVAGGFTLNPYTEHTDITDMITDIYKLR